MMLQSLRSKIFLLLTGMLALVAVLILALSRQSVTKALSEREQHAVENVMQLAESDIRARWEASLSNKVRMVRGERAALLRVGRQIASVLQSYDDLAKRVGKTQADAQNLARTWLVTAPSSAQRIAYAYDSTFTIRASTSDDLVGLNLAQLKDLKGQPLAASMLEETRHFGEGFSAYRAPLTKNSPQSITWFAHFLYFKPWDWVIVVAYDSETLQEQMLAHRKHMEQEVADSLKQMTLAQSGFLLVYDEEKSDYVAPPPREHAADPLLKTVLMQAKALREQEDEENNFHVEDTNGDTWHVRQLYFAPLKWTLMALVPEADIQNPAEALMTWQFLVFALVLALIWLIASGLVAYIVAPLSHLAGFVHRFPEQALQKEASVPLAISELPERHHDEIGQLAAAFLQMNTRLRENVGQLVAETAMRGRIENELNIARDIQMGLQPSPLPPQKRQRVDMASCIQSAKEVGGDLYDFFQISDDSLCLIAGDVSGKGVPAALFMAITRTLVRVAAEIDPDPAHIMARVNDRLAENNPNLMFVTLLIGVVNFDSMTLSWCNAGHPPPLRVLPTGAVEVLSGRSGPACGIKGGRVYRSYETPVKPGEQYIAYTDGITEAFDPSGRQYGDARLLAALAIPNASAQQLLDRVMQDLHTFVGDAEQFDDITLFIVGPK